MHMHLTENVDKIKEKILLILYLNLFVSRYQQAGKFFKNKSKAIANTSFVYKINPTYMSRLIYNNDLTRYPKAKKSAVV